MKTLPLASLDAVNLENQEALSAEQTQGVRTASKALTPAMMRALERAAVRERGNICPIRGAWAAAETALIKAMDRRGFITWDHPEGYRIGDSGFVHHGAPRISEAGRAAIARAIGAQS